MMSPPGLPYGVAPKGTVIQLPRSEAPPGVDSLIPVVGAHMSSLLEELAAYAALDETVLLQGETGTGKTRLAAWVHQRSSRAGGPLVTANLLGVPESGQEAALFGVEAGAFTDVRAQPGLVRRAEGGTLFIDEVDKLSLCAQARLLRLLDTREFLPLGSAREQRADLRLIVASNRPLPGVVAAGGFLEDLFYRVHVLSVEVPPLRARLDEVTGWAEHFLAEGATALRQPTPRLAPGVERMLLEHRWPGNLRELHNTMRRALALSTAATRTLTDPHPWVDAALLERVLGPAPAMRPGARRRPAPSVHEETDLDILRDTARRLVLSRERRGAPPADPTRPGPARLLDALLLLEAVEATGSTRGGFALLGLEARVAAGNAARDLERARQLVAAGGAG